MDAIDHLWHLIVHKVGQEVALLLLSVLSVIGYMTLRYLGASLGEFGAFCVVEGAPWLPLAERTKDGPREGRGVWVAEPIEHPDNYKRDVEGAKVLVLANLKGGVGKTTIAANIAAFLAKDSSWGKRVLLIDLDYRDSLSSMVLPDNDRWLPPPGQDSIATRAISGDLEPAVFVSCAKEAKQEPRLKIITAHYDLAQADNRLLMEWLLQCAQRSSRNLRHAIADLLSGKLFRMRDVRYNLADLLHSDAVRTAFDLVIIDCPPQLTTGMVQALCAGSHLLIPTILDRPSAEAVTRLTEQIETLKERQVCPHLKYIGVVATKYRSGLLAGQAAQQRIQDDLRKRKIDAGLLPSDAFVPHTVALVREADEGIAYLVMWRAKWGYPLSKRLRSPAERNDEIQGISRIPIGRSEIQGR